MRKYSSYIIAAVAILLITGFLSWKADGKAHAAKADGEVKTVSRESRFEQYVSGIYQAANLQGTDLDINVFKKALVGFYNMKQEGILSKDLITIVDLSRSSKQKRLWVIDVANRKLLFNSLVAHGQGSGDDVATNFSNNAESHQSSLGFYVTEGTYFGKHGLSLKLNGMDAGYNNNALSRAIVMHAADYVSQNFINQHGRLGRSFGCPALPPELSKPIIDQVKGHSCLFINGTDGAYKSNFLNQQNVFDSFNAG
ncbi:hypothetical protein GS399_07770 [Pedobacter sp. HMF7647]|uniref:Murein L,D-transpeptidase catalytic domain family protein n=1 Tax=Hufsiella arboris TaxID=2695275 RepID=A0A7K1Y9S1_9SPHI|nr:murein L,D-transpeptidase catalytic domain family protein [Hufsiella arboris]MXV50869.1 hypothetical protein [Hufsiella arboris]